MFEPGSIVDALNRVSAILSREQAVGSSLTEIADILREVAGCSDSGIWLVDETGQTLELKITNTAASQLVDIRVPVGQGMLGTIAQNQKPVIVTGGQWGTQDDLLAKARFYSAAGVPLLWNGDFFGVLVAMDDMPGRDFTARDVHVVELFALQVAAILAHERAVAEKCGLEQALTEEKERFLHIQGALHQMLEQPDMRANLAVIAEGLQALGWRRVMLALYSEEMTVTGLIARGVSEEEKLSLGSALVPEAVWQRLLAGELESHLLSGWYYLSASEENTAWHPDDLLCAPLRVGHGRVVGLIRIEDPVDTSRPTQETLRALDILVSQAAYIAENFRLLDETARSADVLMEQVDELSMIHRADRELSAHLDVDRVMTLTMDWALRRTGANTGLLALMTDDRRGLIPFTTMGYLGREILDCTEEQPWPLEQGVIGRAARMGQTQIVRDVTADEDYVQFMPGARSQIAVPLSMRGEVLGVIMLVSRDEKAFDEHDASFLERLARRAAVALDNARLFRQSEQLADDMAVLYTASRSITATLERGEVLQRIAQSMAVAMDCSSAIILDFETDTRESAVLAVYKVGTARDAQEVLPEIGSQLSLTTCPEALRVIELHRPAVLRVADQTISERARECMADSRFQVVLLVPLVAQDELIGLAMMVEGRHDRAFTSNEIFKAETMASQASVALRQAMLYGEVLELEKIKSEMIRMASHDLRNPLNNIMGYLELLSMTLEKTGITPELEEYIGSLRRSAKTMQSLINDLLTLERVESERESEWQQFDLGGLVYEVVEAERVGASLKHQTLLLERQPDVTLVFGSIIQLRQAVTNLVGNAVKYTPEEGRIEVRFFQDGQRLSLTVQDNGYGISKDRQPRIFERFYRAREPGTDHIPGTGLGLSLVRTVIERHGGQVWFTSEVGVGSTFSLWVPAAHPQPR